MRPPFHHWPSRNGVGVFAIVLVVAGAAFFASRWAAGNGSAAAEPPDAVMPGPDVTPVPGMAPDYSKPYWYVPYQNLENKAARYDQVINGIPIGPTVKQPEQQECLRAAREPGAAARQATISGLSLRPGYLPPGAVVEESLTTSCGAETVSLFQSYFVPPVEDSEAQLRAGKNWAAVGHGASFTIFRETTLFPSVQSGLPSARWHAATVAGRPAAAAGPLLAEGYGESEIVIWENGVQTTVHGVMLTLSELTQIAEGLYR